jgi:dihydrolipoamide dehydrogenase
MLFKKNKVDHIKGYGKLLGGGKVEVDGPDGKKTLSAKNIIIASGSSARMLPGLEPDPKKILTNIEILEMTEVPKSMAVIGGGAVGMEFASVYNSFGSDVTVFEMLPRVLPPEDEDVSKEIKKLFEKRGIKIHVDTKVDKIEKTKKGVKLDLQRIRTARLRRWKWKSCSSPSAARRTRKTSASRTRRSRPSAASSRPTNWMRTVEPNVYAIGDIVAGTPQLAHTASMEGLVAVAHIAGKNPEPINYLLNPNATYCEPQVASVGLTEAKAKEAGYDVKIGKFPFAGNSKASILGAHGGFVKVVTDAKYGEILGVHMIGPLVTELIAEAVVAMQSEATVETIQRAIHAHPTLPEAMQDAFNAVDGMQING